MKKSFLFFILLIFAATGAARSQELKAYQIYNKSGQPVDFGAMVRQLSKYDVILFGEYHNNSMNHWLELRLTKALYQEAPDELMLGAEMIERDDQPLLDAYLEGTIDASDFADTARLWKNYRTDYKPLVDFARKHQLHFIATNVPRRYAAMVAKNGLEYLADSLDKQEKKLIARLPVVVDTATPGYAELRAIMKKHAGTHDLDNFVAAQAIKDATMAESIIENRRRKTLFLHFNGDYHSKQYGGIYWYLKKEKSRLKVAVISIFKQEQPALPLPDDAVTTEFNIVLPEDMTATY